MSFEKKGVSFVLAMALAGIASATTCSSVQPIYVDIHKRAVSGSEELQYGSYVGLGSPAQNQSLWPSLRQNETTFAYTDFCLHSDIRHCTNRTGGTIDPVQSTSWRGSYSNLTANDNSSSFMSGSDTLHLYTHYYYTDLANDHVIPDMPVRIETGGPNHRPNTLGLGSSSTLLQKMYDLGQIASKTYSLYIGTAFDRASGTVNGSNVFGGYDSSRFKAPVYTYPMDLTQSDYLPVTVTDIVIEHPSNPLHDRISIMADIPFEARITTDRYPMTLPYSVTNRFINTVQASPATRSADVDIGRALHLTRPFNGTLTIVLAGGFNVTLPPEAITAPGDKHLSSIVGVAQNYTGPYYLSAAWLSQVYLMLDFEAKQFHLAQALPNAPYSTVKTLCPGSTPVAAKGKTHRHASWNKGHIGAVIGGVVGGAALVLALLTMCFVRKRRSLARQREAWAEQKAYPTSSAIAVGGVESKRSTGSSADLEMQKGIQDIGVDQRPMQKGRQFSTVSAMGPTVDEVNEPAPAYLPVGDSRQRSRVVDERVGVVSRSVSPVSVVSRYSTVEDRK